MLVAFKALLSKFWGAIVGVLSFIGLLIYMVFASRKIGNEKAKADAAEERSKQVAKDAKVKVAEAEESAKASVKVIKEREHVQNDVAVADGGAVIDKLRNKWQRD